MQIDYSDGQQVESHIRDLILKANDCSSEARIGTDEYHEWAIEYHLCPERTNLLRPFDFSGLDILEVGAGMGAISRLLAERAKHLTIIEGTESRFGALEARLRDLDNWTGHVGNLIDIELDEKFDAVVVIGVLEYAELFIAPDETTGHNPFERFLHSCKRFLKPNGTIILAIENRIGLKYWSGVGEDHLGTQFDGICGYADTPTAKTFSKKELTQLFQQVGFSEFEWFYPYPDYKIPNALVSQALVDHYPYAASALSNTKQSRDYVTPNAKRLFPEILAQENMANAGLLDEFSNSFLIVASSESENPTTERLLKRYRSGELAWYYSNRRTIPVETIFSTQMDNLVVSKRPMQTHTPKADQSLTTSMLDIKWLPSENEPYLEGTPFLNAWYQKGYFETPEAPQELLERFIGWSLSHWTRSANGDTLPGTAIDAVASNAILQAHTFALFDLEWESSKPIPASWFIFRNLICLSPHRTILASSSTTTLKDWYLHLCKTYQITPNMASDIERESHFQALTYSLNPEEIYPRIQTEMEMALPAEGYPRKNGTEQQRSLVRRLARRGLHLARKLAP